MHIIVFLKQNMADMRWNLVNACFHVRTRCLKRAIGTSLHAGHLFFTWSLAAYTYTPYRSSVTPPGFVLRTASVYDPPWCACGPWWHVGRAGRHQHNTGSRDVSVRVRIPASNDDAAARMGLRHTRSARIRIRYTPAPSRKTSSSMWLHRTAQARYSDNGLARLLALALLAHLS